MEGYWNRWAVQRLREMKNLPRTFVFVPRSGVICEYDEDVGGVILSEEQREEFGKRVGQA